MTPADLFANLGLDVAATILVTAGSRALAFGLTRFLKNLSLSISEQL